MTLRKEMVNISQRRHRINVQSPVYSQDEIGGVNVEWIHVALLWASVAPLKGRESYSHSAIHGNQIMKFILRYRDDITEDMRIVFEQRSYMITSISQVDEQRRMLVIYATYNR